MIFNKSVADDTGSDRLPHSDEDTPDTGKFISKLLVCAAKNQSI
jgi:hypothetical protein